MKNTDNKCIQSPGSTTSIPERSSCRHSGIELLRFVSMLLILSLHVNFYAFGSPSATDFQTAPISSLLRTAFESLAIIGVNSFVLISGWFGIRPRANRVVSLLFQTTFFCCLLFVVGLALGVSYSSADMVKSIFLLGGPNWFLRSYILLYVISPLLESFIATATKKSYQTTLVVFFSFQTFYGWLIPGEDYFELFRRGYSLLSFLGLYLLARYIRVFRPRFACRSRCTDLVSYFVLSLVTALASVLQTLCHQPVVDFFAYNSPLVVAASMFLFLFFAKWAFSSRIVNSVAQSSLAVYLLHMHPSVCGPLFIPVAVLILRLPDLGPLLILPYLLFVFAVAILLDKVRIALWMVFVKAIDRSRPSLGQMT